MFCEVGWASLESKTVATNCGTYCGQYTQDAKTHFCFWCRVLASHSAISLATRGQSMSATSRPQRHVH